MVKQKRSSGEIAEILTEYVASGKTQRAFSEARGLPLSTLTMWLRRAKRAENIPATTSSWVPVVSELLMTVEK